MVKMTQALIYGSTFEFDPNSVVSWTHNEHDQNTSVTWLHLEHDPAALKPFGRLVHLQPKQGYMVPPWTWPEHFAWSLNWSHNEHEQKWFLNNL